ncbi:hypothetical protein EJB05_25242, partial [Eragrostis curvula]
MLKKVQLVQRGRDYTSEIVAGQVYHLQILKTLDGSILWHNLSLEVAPEKKDGQRGGIEEFIRQSSREFVVANLEHFEHGAIAKPSGDAATELIVGKVKTPSRRLKLTSRTMMLLENISSDGRPPDNELYDRLRCIMLVRLAREDEMCPSSLLDAKETPVTPPLPLQVMPSHAQQFVCFCHDKARPPSCESPERNWKRKLFSCSVHEVAREIKEKSFRRRAQRNGAMANLLVCTAVG